MTSNKPLNRTGKYASPTEFDTIWHQPSLVRPSPAAYSPAG